MKESLQEKKKRAKKIISLLRKEYPLPKTALEFISPLDLLVATILSAQTTDERVNIVTNSLFQKYRTTSDYANANPAEFEKEIGSVNFFRNKTKSIINCAKAIVENHKGEVPKTTDELVSLPGVGRKTANCVLGSAYGIAEGVVVDTHVLRISGKLGLTKESNAEKVEIDLMEILPKRDWIDFSNIIILHGRKVCNARKPKCGECVVSKYCPSAESNNANKIQER